MLAAYAFYAFIWLFKLSKKHTKMVSIDPGNMPALVNQQNVVLTDTRMR